MQLLATWFWSRFLHAWTLKNHVPQPTNPKVKGNRRNSSTICITLEPMKYPLSCPSKSHSYSLLLHLLINQTHSWLICWSSDISRASVRYGPAALGGTVMKWPSTNMPSPSMFDNVSHTTRGSCRNPWSVTNWNNSFCNQSARNDASANTAQQLW
jgi:hypothetical protein